MLAPVTPAADAPRSATSAPAGTPSSTAPASGANRSGSQSSSAPAPSSNAPASPATRSGNQGTPGAANTPAGPTSSATRSGSQSSTASVPAAPAAAATRATSTAAPASSDSSGRPDYILQPSDLIRIDIFQEDDLKQEVRISQQHSINLPLIGQVNLRGLTVRQAQTLIRDRYDKDYLVNPQVTVTVMDYAKTYVNVLGSVMNAGPIAFPPEQGMTLMDAVSKAGGFNRMADKKKVGLSRTLDGKTEKQVINTEDILSGKVKDIPLIKDDVINVPENLL